jgi:hypothetical protein
MFPPASWINKRIDQKLVDTCASSWRELADIWNAWDSAGAGISDASATT